MGNHFMQIKKVLLQGVVFFAIFITATAYAAQCPSSFKGNEKLKEWTAINKPDPKSTYTYFGGPEWTPGTGPGSGAVCNYQSNNPNEGGVLLGNSQLKPNINLTNNWKPMWPGQQTCDPTTTNPKFKCSCDGEPNVCPLQ